MKKKNTSSNSSYTASDGLCAGKGQKAKKRESEMAKVKMPNAIRETHRQCFFLHRQQLTYTTFDSVWIKILNWKTNKSTTHEHTVEMGERERERWPHQTQQQKKNERKKSFPSKSSRKTY